MGAFLSGYLFLVLNRHFYFVYDIPFFEMSLITFLVIRSSPFLATHNAKILAVSSFLRFCVPVDLASTRNFVLAL